MISEIDDLIGSSLTEFLDAVRRSKWVGREREAVSLYAFGFLQYHVSDSGVLKVATQIGVEVCVPSGKSLNPKGRVNKDLVLWPEPGMTCWNQDWKPENHPLAILEWKCLTPRNQQSSSSTTVSRGDIDWLRQYAEYCPSAFVGYSISLNLRGREPHLSVTRIEKNHIQDKWLER